MTSSAISLQYTSVRDWQTNRCTSSHCTMHV